MFNMSMSFGEELSKIDTKKVDEIFDELILGRGGSSNLGNGGAFLRGEIASSDERFPVFDTIVQKSMEVSDLMLKDGAEPEKIFGIYYGIRIAQVVLSAYAETEVPDTIPLDLETGPPKQV